MRTVSLRYTDLAHRLLQAEAEPNEQPPGAPAGERTCARLREGLAKLVGPAGFDALLRRALHLAQAEHPLLKAVQVQDGSCLAGLAEQAAGQDPGQVRVALVALFGSFLDLLSSFIGDDLAWRQLCRIWPDVPLERAVPGAEEAAQ